MLGIKKWLKGKREQERREKLSFVKAKTGLKISKLARRKSGFKNELKERLRNNDPSYKISAIKYINYSRAHKLAEVCDTYVGVVDAIHEIGDITKFLMQEFVRAKNLVNPSSFVDLRQSLEQIKASSGLAQDLIDQFGAICNEYIQMGEQLENEVNSVVKEAMSEVTSDLAADPELRNVLSELDKEKRAVARAVGGA